MFAPVSSRYKVYIVDEAHMVSTAGFNALLKLVEEPPEHVRFIFATTEVEKVLPTIRSRTFNYTFRLVPARVLQQHLAQVCEAEGVAADPAALALVARAAGGSVRDGLSVLGQLIAGSGPEGLTHEDVAAQLGVTDAALLDDSILAIAHGEGAQLFAAIDRVIDAGHDPRRFATDLLQRLRNLIVLAAVPSDDALALLDAPDAEIEAMRTQVAAFTLPELSRAADLVSDGLSDLKGATAPRLQLELLAARLLLPGADDSSLGLAVRLERLERSGIAVPRSSSTASASRGAPSASNGRSKAAEPTESPGREDAGERHEPSVRGIASPAEESAPSSGPPSRPKPSAAPAPSEAVSPAAAEPPPPPPPPMSQVTSTAAPADEDTPPSPPTEDSPVPVSAALRAAPSTDRSALGLTDVSTMWPAVLEALKVMSRVAWLVFSDSVPLSLSDGTLAVGVPEEAKVNNARSSGHTERLRQVVLDVVHLDVSVDVVATGIQSPASTPVVADVPSPDDDVHDEVSGEELLKRELGATVIGEIEQG